MFVNKAATFKFNRPEGFVGEGSITGELWSVSKKASVINKCDISMDFTNAVHGDKYVRIMAKHNVRGLRR